MEEEERANAIALATLAADNKWIQTSMIEMAQGIKDVNTKLDGNMVEMRSHYATSERVAKLEALVETKADISVEGALETKVSKRDFADLNKKFDRVLWALVTTTITFSGAIVIEILRASAGKGGW